MTALGRVALVGGSGMLGAPVAARLRADGATVRIVVRDAGRARAVLGDNYEFVQADVTDPAAAKAALAGMDAVHISLRDARSVAQAERTERLGSANVAEAAGELGLRRVSYLSGAGLESAPPAIFPVASKLAAEASVRAGGASWTVFRATHFMESLPQFIHEGRATIFGRQSQRYHYLAAADYARMVSAALAMPEAANRTFVLLGPQPYTMKEALGCYLKTAAPHLRPGMLPIPVARLVGRLRGKPELQFAAELFRAFQRIPETGDRTEADRLLGPATTKLQDWCMAHKPAEPAAAKRGP